MPTTGTSPEVFPPTFYPDAPDLSSAQGFELKPGQELPLDLTLSSGPAFRVSGIVTGGPLPASVICQDDQGQPVSFGMVDSRTGKFLLPKVPRGSWMLHAFSQPSQQDGAPEALLPIQVSSSNIQGLVLQLQPLPTIPVHIQDRPSGQGLIVRLTPVNGTNQNRRLDAHPAPGDPPGSLSLHGVPPGNYKVSARMLDNSACVGSVMSASSDFIHGELTVTAGSSPPPIEITLRNDCATISGTVHSSSEGDITGSVILLGDAPSPLTAALAADGKFSFSNVTPGAYRLLAFNDISDLEYANPEALRDFIGQSLTAGPNEKATVQLDLVMRGK